MQGQYNIAIMPSEAVNALVKRMKEKLADKVGWFHSKNAMGHITICEFKATEKEIEKVKRQLIRLCDGFEPVEVTLNDFGSYPNGAFFIAPDAASKNRLKPIMKRVNDTLLVKDLHKSDDPHLTIARRLAPDKLTTAKRMYTSINVRFLCDNIVLREFDPEVKQYFVAEVFPFKGNPQEGKQATLF